MESVTQQKFLSFQLGEKDIAVIPLDDIIEVLPVTLGKICSVPQMPSWVLGIYSWRSEMLWLVELDEMLGYEPTSFHSCFEATVMAIVLQIEGKSLGLIVRKVLDIKLLDPMQMNLPDSTLFNPKISRLTQGYFINDLGTIVIRLDITNIFKYSG